MPPPPLYASRDFGWQQRYPRFCGRVVVFSILVLLLYPFLWAWTVIGTLWFSSAKNCVCFIPVLPFSVLLLTSFWCIMQLITCSCLKWLKNGAFSSGYFLAIVDSFALLACLWVSTTRKSPIYDAHSTSIVRARSSFLHGGIFVILASSSTTVLQKHVVE